MTFKFWKSSHFQNCDFGKGKFLQSRAPLKSGQVCKNWSSGCTACSGKRWAIFIFPLKMIQREDHWMIFLDSCFIKPYMFASLFACCSAYPCLKSETKAFDQSRTLSSLCTHHRNLLKGFEASTIQSFNSPSTTTHPTLQQNLQRTKSFLRDISWLRHLETLLNLHLWLISSLFSHIIKNKDQEQIEIVKMFATFLKLF